MSVCPSVRPSVHYLMEQHGSHWTNFHEIWYLSIFRKSVEKIYYKFTRIIGTLHADQCTFMFISCSVLLRMRNVSDKICRENQKAHFIFNTFFFRKSCRLWDNVEKYSRRGQATWRYITARALCMLSKYGYRHTLIISSTYFFSAARVVSERTSILRLYVDGLSCLFHDHWNSFEA